MEATAGHVEAALPAVTAAGTPWARAETAAECGDLLVRVVDQTRRRVFDGEAVNFATGRSGLVLDAVEGGNPADSEHCLPMLRRHVEHHSAPARHALPAGHPLDLSSNASESDRITFRAKCVARPARSRFEAMLGLCHLPKTRL